MPLEKFLGMQLVAGIRALLGQCAELGLDVEQLVTQAGLDPQVHANARALPSRSARLALWRAAIAASGDPQLHLHVVEHAPFGAYFADLICAASPTLEEALRVQAELLGEVERVFGCSIRYGYEESRLWLRAADLQLANNRHDPVLLAWLKSAVPAAPSAQDLHPVLSQVEASLRDALATGTCSVKRTARHLGMSKRTLQRRLAELDTSFSQVLNHVRRQVACQLLTQGHSLIEISERLGYSEHSAFSRAFKRWTGVPPSAFRA